MGGLLLYSLDLSQRDYDVMRVRGYQERLVVTLPTSDAAARDVAFVAGALLALLVSALWRAGAATLNPYSWLVPILPAILLLASLASTIRRSA